MIQNERSSQKQRFFLSFGLGLLCQLTITIKAIGDAEAAIEDAEARQYWAPQGTIMGQSMRCETSW